MRRVATFVLVVAAVVLTGCTRTVETEAKGVQEWRPTTTTTYYEPDPIEEEDLAIELLVENVPEFEDVPFDELSEFLDLVCDEIDAEDGDFLAVGEIVVEASEGYFDLDYGDAGYIVGTAVLVSCPEWDDPWQEFLDS